MKKLYTLLAGALFVSAAASAQRMVDVSATLTAPAANGTITSAQSFAINAVITNVGTTAVKATDTLLYAYSLDNSILSLDGSGDPTIFFKTGRQMAHNDTLQLNRTLTFTFPHGFNGAHTLCIVTLLTNGSADSVVDNVDANNESCSTVNFAGGSTVGVNTVVATTNANNVLSVYPMPAHNEANFDLFLGNNATVTVKITDLVGRTVALENKGMLTKGKQTVKVNIGDVANGIYLYQVMMGNEVSAGKISVSK